MLGSDSDNGAEFINGTLARYSALYHITLTRSRPHKKKDPAYVERKNWSVVLRMISYGRYEGSRAAAQMKSLYDHMRPYVNYFQPLMKMTTKKRLGGRLYKSMILPGRPISASSMCPGPPRRANQPCNGNPCPSTGPRSYATSSSFKNSSGGSPRVRSIHEATNHSW